MTKAFNSERGVGVMRTTHTDASLYNAAKLLQSPGLTSQPRRRKCVQILTIFQERREKQASRFITTVTLEIKRGT